MGKGGKKDIPSDQGVRTISINELKKHNRPGDAWLALFGKVYDISTWTDHPGGRVIYSAAGSDATDSFKAFHSPVAEAMLKKELESRTVGILESKSEAANLSAFEKEYRDLYKSVKERGLMQANPFYYIYKVSFNLSMLAFAAYLTVNYDSLAIKLTGAFIVALFWQQCGWLAHDFAHHQVFKNRLYNDMMVLFVGNFCQAFSLDWWKNKHNTHHAIPNLHESAVEAHDGDPDIDTLPFLAWSKKLIQKTLPGGPAASNFSAFCVRYQAFLYFPILFFARITWVLQSLSYAFTIPLGFFGSEVEKQKEVAKALENRATASNSEEPAIVNSLRYPIAERVLLILHWTWYLILAFGPWNGWKIGILYFFVSQTFSGLLLAIAFGVGHNGMEVFDADNHPGFAELQVRTTRNVHDNYLNGWFMGGLHYQVEHHLFPMIPRHNLRYVKDDVIALCKKHKVPYRCTGLWEGTIEVLAYLGNVTKTLKEFPAV